MADGYAKGQLVDLRQADIVFVEDSAGDGSEATHPQGQKR
jgi:hypothetical protein